MLQSINLVTLIFGRLQLNFEFLIADVESLWLYSVLIFQLFQMTFGTSIIFYLCWHRVKLILLLHVLGHIKNFLLLHIIKHSDLHFLALLFILSIYYHLSLQISLIITLRLWFRRVGQDVLGFMLVILHLTAFICVLLFIFLKFILLIILFFNSFFYLNLFFVKSFWWQKFTGCIDKIVEIALLVSEKLNESSMILLLSLFLFFGLLHKIFNYILLVGGLLLFRKSRWQGLGNLRFNLLGDSYVPRHDRLILPFTLYWRVIIRPSKTYLLRLALHSIGRCMLHHKTMYYFFRLSIIILLIFLTIFHCFLALNRRIVLLLLN